MLQFQHKVVHARYCAGFALLSVVFSLTLAGGGLAVRRGFSGGKLIFPKEMKILEKTLRKNQKPQKILGYNLSRVRESCELYLLLLLPVVHLLFMNFMPMPGIAIAFQNYKIGQQEFLFGENIRWVGLKHFETFLTGRLFTRLVGNTLRISIKSLICTFPIPIIFALALNEVKHMQTKKVVQTLSYMPHFISTVVVGGMVLSFLKTDGLINVIIEAFGGKATAIMNDPDNFDIVYILTIIWISFGFDSILYMSAISGIDQELYEAARLDGASRWQQVWYITLPGILPTVSICLIMALGGILGANTDLILNLYNTANRTKSDVIGTYVYRVGLGIEGASGSAQFSPTAAIGLFTSLINITMLFIANKISNLLTDTGLW